MPQGELESGKGGASDEKNKKIASSIGEREKDFERSKATLGGFKRKTKKASGLTGGNPGQVNCPGPRKQADKRRSEGSRGRKEKGRPLV